MKRQHKSPCAKCPFRRDAVPGWLGGLSPDEFRALAQSEIRMACHTHAGRAGVDYIKPDLSVPQCAGRSIYWANQVKRPRDASLLDLPRDTATVFQWPAEFVEYHKLPITERGRDVRAKGIKP